MTKITHILMTFFSKVVLAEDGIWNGTECWVINPFRYDVLPADDAVKRTTPIIRENLISFYQSYSFTLAGYVTTLYNNNAGNVITSA